MKAIRILFILGYLFTHTIFAQQKGLELIHADKTIGKKIGGEKVSEFSGHVHFQQDTVDMYCDRAVFYEKQARLDFVGHVKISDSLKTIWANKVEYYPDSRLAVCLGDVKIKTEDTEVTSRYFSYNFKEKKARARGDLFIDDKPNAVKIWGEQGLHDALLKYSFVQSQVRLMKIDTSAGDTLTVTGERLEYFGKDTAKAVVQDSVVLCKGALKAVCDTLIYLPDEEIAWLNYKPRAWYEQNELSGERMKVYFDSLQIRQIHINGQAEALNVQDSLEKKTNVLKGRKIRFEIEGKKPQKVVSMGNASSVYYLKQEEQAKGRNEATADTISIFFKEGEVDSIRIRGGAQGVYHPREQIKERKVGTD